LAVCQQLFYKNSKKVINKRTNKNTQTVAPEWVLWLVSPSSQQKDACTSWHNLLYTFIIKSQQKKQGDFSPCFLDGL
jgi:hypothetical protein